MFNVSKINGLYGVVGLRQPSNPTYAILDSDNTTSRSGYYASDNPFVKIEFLKSNTDYKDISDADFNTYLKGLQEESIVNVCGMVFNESDFIDRQVLYPNTQNNVNTENLTGGLITHRIQVSPDKNIAFEISRVLLLFEGSGDINLMLFNTSSPNPIFSKVITINTSSHEEVLDWRVDNSGGTYKGEYYFGYRSNYNGIGTLKPYKRDYENSNIESCVSHLNIDKFQFVGHSSDILPDLTIKVAMSQSTGLNPDITVYEDYTDLIVQNEMLFAKAINLEFQINCLSQYLASLRSNNEQKTSERIMLRVIQEIEGQDRDGLVKITGLRPQLLRSIVSISKEIDRLRRGYFGGRIKRATLV